MKRLGVLLPCDRARLGGREPVFIHRPDPRAVPCSPRAGLASRVTDLLLTTPRNWATWLPFLFHVTTRITLEHAISLSYYFAFCLRRPLKCQHAEDGDFSPFPDECSGPTSGPEVYNGYSRKFFILYNK